MSALPKHSTSTITVSCLIPEGSISRQINRVPSRPVSNGTPARRRNARRPGANLYRRASRPAGNDSTAQRRDTGI